MFDPTKPTKTRDGRDVRILATDLSIQSGYDYPETIGAVVDGQFYSYKGDGSYMDGGRHSDLDLVNVEPEVTRYFSAGDSYTAEEYARKSSPFSLDYSVFKVVTSGDRVVSTELLPAAA